MAKLEPEPPMTRHQEIERLWATRAPTPEVPFEDMMQVKVKAGLIDQPVADLGLQTYRDMKMAMSADDALPAKQLARRAASIEREFGHLSNGRRTR